MMTAAVFLLVQKARIHSPRIVAMLANLTKCGLGIYLAHYFFIGPAYLATVALGLPAALRVPGSPQRSFSAAPGHSSPDLQTTQSKNISSGKHYRTTGTYRFPDRVSVAQTIMLST